MRGRVRSQRAASWRAGDRVVVAGERVALGDDRRHRVASQHVVGAIDAEWLGDAVPGDRLGGASNRVRTVIARGAAHLPPDRAALTRGLVIGDDRDEPAEMVQRFRDAGLSHLTAVSGQNVALLLAAAGPLLRRIRAGPRWLVTLGLIGWFVVLTRAEPSVLRAGVMAALGATAFVLGRQAEPRAAPGGRRRRPVADRSAAGVVGRVLAVGRRHGRGRAGRPAPRPPAAPARSARPCPSPSPSAPSAAWPCPACSSSDGSRWSAPSPTWWRSRSPGWSCSTGCRPAWSPARCPFVGPIVMAPVGWGVWWVDAVATVGAAVEPDARRGRGWAGWWWSWPSRPGSARRLVRPRCALTCPSTARRCRSAHTGDATLHGDVRPPPDR